MILTDGEEIASFAYGALKRYLELYESARNYPDSTMVPLVSVPTSPFLTSFLPISQVNFDVEIKCFVEGYLEHLCQTSIAMQQELPRI